MKEETIHHYYCRRLRIRTRLLINSITHAHLVNLVTDRVPICTIDDDDDDNNNDTEIIIRVLL